MCIPGSPHAHRCCIKVNILLIFILAFAAVVIKFCIVGTAILKNISDRFNRIVHLNTTESGREDPNTLDGIDVDASSYNSDTSDEAAMSMARTTWASAQQLALASFQTVTETAARGVLWTMTPNTVVDDALPLSTRRTVD